MTSDSIRKTRITKELAELTICWPIDDQRMDILETRIIGPPGTPYENGSFILRIELPDRYPFEPPRVRFVTKIYHPNIDKENGRICLGILKTTRETSWKPTFNINTVLDAVRSLIAEPNPDDPVEPEIAEQLLLDNDRFVASARQWTERYARRGSTDVPQTSGNTNLEEDHRTFSDGDETAKTDHLVHSKSDGIKHKLLFSSKAKSTIQCSEKVATENHIELIELDTASDDQKIVAFDHGGTAATAGTSTLSKQEAPASSSPQSSAPIGRIFTPKQEATHSSQSRRTKTTKPVKEGSAKKEKWKTVDGARREKAPEAQRQQKRARYEDLFLDDKDELDGQLSE